ncbi:VWA domain-containing protein [Halomonas sp. I1]|uniref:VWA domain-containing protein n=1 Tax=Halomonas sp. I1 TaxID=393536 RepID=UPI0028DE7C80|nr:VWA domain-containing protein [Halomonas sp. I1]MDT8896484.1 VWA domain-containing protein [Halomonas sp. I1]
MKKVTLRSTVLALAGWMAFAASVNAADESVMIVFDGSNSMWGQIDGTAKIDIARNGMENLLGEWTESRKVGLMAYGHRRRGDCTDMETMVVPSEGTRAEILDRVGTVTPTGKTPLTSAVEQAATELSYIDTPATVVLISDGLESCERDPCALAETLENGGIGFTAHVVGFGLGDADTSALSCVAEKTGGQYIEAGNAEELGQALSAVGTAVSTPRPEPKPARPEVIVSGPEAARAGSLVRVSWDKVLDKRDYVTIVPTGTEAGEYDNYIRVKDREEGDIRIPADTGMYELRYMASEDDIVLGTAAIEVTEPDVTVSGPETALAGERFPVEWAGAVDGEDYITIVPMGAEEGSYTNYFRVRDESTKTLQAPAETGLYELRYVLKEGGRTLARQPIEITEPEVTVSGPETALAGGRFPVEWTDAVDGEDYITIVPMGAEEGSYTNYFRVRDESTKTLQAPAETGLYELRYVLKEGGRTLARQPIEITEPEVTISGPDEVRAGTKIPVQWTGAVDGEDYITIVPMGAEEGSYTHYFRVRDKSKEMLQAPAEKGLYELRYVLKEGDRTMARHMIEVLATNAALESGASLSAPDTAAPGTVIEVDWSVKSDSTDQRITLARSNQAIFTWVEAVKISGEPPVQIPLPEEPGLYELRFLDVANREVLSRKVIKVE